MHFLSHFYVEQPETTPLFVVGLIIPDLTPGFSKIYNTSIKQKPLPANNSLSLIQQGIERHYEGDKTFHNSPDFMQQVANATQSFIAENLNRTRLRLSVIAHVAVELMIDRQILLENQDICVDFYDVLNKAEDIDLHAYFSALGQTNAGTHFMARWNFFKERKFLFMFTELENIAGGLSRIYKNVTGTEFTEAEKASFVVALNNIETELRYSWKEILKA